MFFSEITKPNGFFQKPPHEGTYVLHQYVWSLFGGAHASDKRDFLYSLYNGKLYIVSVREPVDKSPDETVIRSHDYGPKFSEGQVLRFDVRLNAETKKGQDEQSFQNRVSIVTAQRIDEGDDFDGNWNRIAYESADRWFNEYSVKHGFKVRDFRVMNTHRYGFKNSKEETIKFLSLDLQGVLEVVGPSVFTFALHKGIGRSRGFGCGLILVAP